MLLRLKHGPEEGADILSIVSFQRKVHEATGQRPPAKRLVSLTPPDQHLTGAMIAAMKATERADGERVVSPLHSIGCLVLYAHWTGWV